MSKSKAKDPGKKTAHAGKLRRQRRSTTYPESFSAIVDGIDYGILDDLVGYAIRRAQISIYADFFDAIDDPDITPQRFASLVVIGANPGLRQVELARIQGIAKPGATALVDFWEKRGFVERRTTLGDRRSNGIYLSKEGERGLDDLKATVIEHEKEMMDCLSSKERKQLIDSLMKIAVRGS